MVHMTDTTTREAANASSMRTLPVCPSDYGYRVRDQFERRILMTRGGWLRDGED